MKRRILLSALAAGLFSGSAGARIATYVESASTPEDPDEIVLGYPVPEARDQAAPFAGFRSLNGLYLRAAELALEDTGPRLSLAETSPEGRRIEQLCFGPPGQAMQILQTGGIHAREWAAPEAVMGLAEAFTLRRDQPLIAWVAETIPFCLVPVLNPDGFAQTQREALQTRICEAPEESGAEPDCEAASAYPRDGRMRRKNLRDSDGLISSSTDAFNGVDLNRNNAPYWATRVAAGRSSNDPQAIIYHGPAAASEAEVEWLHTLVADAAPDQFRLFVDTHSFSRLFFWNCTGRKNLDTTANTWIERFRGAARNAYDNVPTGDPQTGAGCGEFGIGATDELFAFDANAPSFTLELEPSFANGAAEYGGFGISHGGFILPESVVPQMREDVIRMMTLAYAMTAGPAWVQSVQVQRDSGLVYAGHWNTGPTARTLETQRNGELQGGDAVRLIIDFDRPMRWLDGDVVRTYPGQTQELNPRLRLRSGGQSWELDSATGSWESPEAGYATQRFVLDTRIPSDWDGTRDLQLEISAGDNATMPVDANPGTLPDWSRGRFTQVDSGPDACHLIARLDEAENGCTQTGKKGSGGGLSVLMLIALVATRRTWLAQYQRTR